ncbi:flagellar motor switch protein FliM [Desulfofustis limnaeus]|uniref:Flagellar motor switch protein FliM n=1 Tax=Desulfofustis limnaeus TaxID=2740163 RepID=A0ABN6M367_9BACT|nr:FliM/FliN family flagellar motor switch protein [Desulfofustis limnaeus]MDX9896848.1 FliM/FliN family flagellar motor switch protein [Desulfofustis sp.]BDD87341.1 flagellar motor switch protein FliM [Desulfofustis limnaeus]
MEPILSKQEIAELLAAIKSGRMPLDLEDDDRHRQPVLACEPVDLFTIAAQRDSQIRIPNFDIILDSFGQNYAVSLSNQLQRTFSIVRVGMESSSFQDYLLSKTKPGAMGVLNLPPLKNGALIVYDQSLAFTLVEIMLGAAAEAELLQPDRQLTKIELTVLRASMEKSCSDLERAFRPITTLTGKLLKIENNPRLVSITEPDSEVVVGSFNISVNETTASLELVFPVAALDPYRDEFRDLLNVNTPKHEGWTESITEALQEMALTVVARSGVVDLSIGRVRDFRAGDFIPVEYDLNSPLTILVEDKPKFFAIPGSHNGKKAVSITGVRH